MIVSRRRFVDPLRGRIRKLSVGAAEIESLSEAETVRGGEGKASTFEMISPLDLSALCSSSTSFDCKLDVLGLSIV